MKPSDEIENVVKKMSFKAGPEMDQYLWAETLKAQNEFHKMMLAPSQHNIGRITMKSPIVKFAVAAILVIACLIGLFFWKGTGSGVALADVLTRIEQAKAYMYQMSLTITGLDESSTPRESSVTLLISQDYGQKATTTRIGSNTGEITCEEMYLLPRQKTMVIVMPEKKAYVRMRLDDTMIERFEKQHNDPRAMIRQILNCEYTSLGQSVINGLTVVGFQTKDPAYTGSFEEQVDVKLWVDAETWLPVRSEMFTVDGTVQTHCVIDNFRWDVSVDAAEFEPVIPDDYTMALGDISLPAFNEETAIKGLRVFADLTGEYPDNLGGIAFMKRLEEIMNRQASEPIKELPLDEKARIVKEIGMPIAGIGSFYQTLVQDKKDPAYYGQFVTPEDTDCVLMRWKVSDNEYRIIFADLHAETVSAETLADLEKDLPK
jgi:outer membrane lipoprotein-sorting protein